MHVYATCNMHMPAAEESHSTIEAVATSFLQEWLSGDLRSYCTLYNLCRYHRGCADKGVLALRQFDRCLATISDSICVWYHTSLKAYGTDTSKNCTERDVASRTLACTPSVKRAVPTKVGTVRMWQANCILAGIVTAILAYLDLPNTDHEWPAR